MRKGGKVVTIPLAPRTARAVDLAVGERCEGPIFLGARGDRLDRHAAGRIVRRVARKAGITKRVGPHTLCTPVSTKLRRAAQSTSTGGVLEIVGSQVPIGAAETGPLTSRQN